MNKATNVVISPRKV